MRTYIILTCVVVFADFAYSQATILNREEGESFKAIVLTFTNQVRECYLVTPKRETVEFKPNNGSNEKYTLLEDTENFSQCQVTINNLDSDDTGLWKLYALYGQNSNDSQEYDVSVRKPFEVEPEYLEQQTFTTYLGGSKSFAIETFAAITSESCDIITPNGDKYDLKNETALIPGIYLQSSADRMCGVRIDVVSEDFAGNWTLIEKGYRYSTPIERRLPIIIYMEGTAEASPSLVTVAEGNNFHISLTNATSEPDTCKLIKPDGEEYRADVNETMSNTCPFNVFNVTSKDNGTWTIVYGSRITYRAPVQVVVVGTPGTATVEQSVWTLDRPLQLTIGPENAIYCKVFEPYGRAFNEGFGRCNISIEKVTSDHAGVWELYVGIHGSVVPQVILLNVNVIEADPKPTVTTSVQVNRPTVAISCSVQSDLFIKACKFRDPSGKILLAHDGVSQTRYNNHGFTSSYQGVAQNHTCGITITEPTVADVGLWRCGVETEDKVLYGHLSVRCPWLVTDPEVAATVITEPTLSAVRSVHALVDESVTLSCSIQAAIRYCYFRVRNGTIFHVSPDKSNYVGAGFDAGECGIRFPGLATTDSGAWSCHVGLNDVKAPEQRRSITVKVEEPLTVRQRGRRHNIRIEAQVYNRRKIDYCVFVRIDGLGFTIDNAPRGYHCFVYPSNGYCELRITNPSTLDLQPWTVLAKISGQDKEVTGVTDIASRGADVSSGFRFPTMWVVVMVVGISLILVGVAVGPYKNRKWVASRASVVRQSFRNSFRKAPPTVNTAVAA
ncbi:unnamed protein product [Leptosia nina]|uniref:Immunoglobulin domain-containing protein n=1 Tax=Leptosia nina TaxID=320188 RepID=A0AAV1JA85_9NEOP